MVHKLDESRLFHQAEEKWSRNQLQSAFKLFLAAAKGGYVKAFRIVGQFYDYGEGVKSSEDAAIYWYRRAYRYDHDPCAATNIGCIWRDRGNINRALFWLRRAVESGDGDANLDIAKIYIRHKPNLKKAISYLKKTIEADWVTEESKEEARSLLSQLTRQKKEKILLE